nr:hypothetical protein [Tautonia plasticadhaerens]
MVRHDVPASAAAFRVRVAAAFLAEADRSSGVHTADAAPPSLPPSRLESFESGVPRPPPDSLPPAAGFLVDRRPGPTLGLLHRDAALLVSFRDVLGLAFLRVRVFRIVAAWHAVVSQNATLPESPVIGPASVRP